MQEWIIFQAIIFLASTFKKLKIYMPDLFQLSNRLGSAKCAADLVPPSAVARTGEQAITIEGGGGDIIAPNSNFSFYSLCFAHLAVKRKKQVLSNIPLNVCLLCLSLKWQSRKPEYRREPSSCKCRVSSRTQFAKNVNIQGLSFVVKNYGGLSNYFYTVMMQWVVSLIFIFVWILTKVKWIRL